MEHKAQQGSDLAQLTRRACEGDQAAFRGWLESTYATVYRVALRMLGDTQEAEDVVQETYVRAWRGMAGLKEPEASLGWVCRITRNVATDRLRRPSRREIPVLDGTIGAQASPIMDRLSSLEPNPEDALLSKEYRARVRMAVGNLNAKYRVVLLLREVDGLSYDEIAAAVGLPRGTVESRIHRARAQVKKSIERAVRRETRSKS